MPSITGQRVPIIAMTAHAMKGDKERCLAAGMDAYVSKPVRPNELLAVMLPFFTPGLEAPEPEAGSAQPQPASPVSTPPMAHEVPPDARVDWAAARVIVLQDEDLLREIVEAFLSEAEQLAVELSTALTSADARTVARLAHTLKSNLRTFGVPCADDMQTMELSAKAGHLDPVKSLWPEVRPLITQVVQQMQTYLASTRPS